MITELAVLIRESIKSDEAYEVAIYAASRYALLQSAEKASALGQTTTPEVSPEALRITAQYDMGLTDNSFYMENWAAIRAMMSMDDIETRTKVFHLRHADKKNDTTSKRVVRDLFTPRFTVLTYIVLKSVGREAANEFDFHMKRLLTLNDAQQRYFRDSGA